jgi:hypothetical protein
LFRNLNLVQEMNMVVLVLLQLMYDSKDAGATFRKFNSVNLAWWHTYKHAANKLWETFAPTVFAPLWQQLYPGSQFHIRIGSFPSLIAHLTFLRVAYPSIKVQLHTLLRRDNLDAHQTNMAANLEFLFEFAIPTVDFFSLCCLLFVFTSMCMWFGQILDYGIKLKLDDGPVMLKHLMRTIKLLILLARGRGNTYVRACILQCLILLYQRKHNTVAWRMFMANMSVFNEEAGEMSFSMLGRAMVGDTIVRKFEHLDKLYKLIHMYRTVESDLYMDGRGFEKNRNWRKKIPQDCETITTVIAFFHTMFRQIKQGKFKVYDGTGASYKSADHARQNLVELKLPAPLWREDVNLDVPLGRMQDKVVTEWMTSFITIWPEFEHLPDPELAVVMDLPPDESSTEEEEEELEEVEEEIEEKEDAVPVAVIQKPKRKRVDQSISSSDYNSGSASPRSRSPSPVRSPSPHASPKSVPSAKSFVSDWHHQGDVDPGRILKTSRRQRKGRGEKKQDPNFPLHNWFNDQ